MLWLIQAHLRDYYLTLKGALIDSGTYKSSPWPPSHYSPYASCAIQVCLLRLKYQRKQLKSDASIGQFLSLLLSGFWDHHSYYSVILHISIEVATAWKAHLFMIATFIIFGCRKHDSSNPYILNLSILDQEMVLNGYCQVNTVCVFFFHWVKSIC